MKIALLYGAAARGGRLASAMEFCAAELGKSREVVVSALSVAEQGLDWADGRPAEKLAPTTQAMLAAVAGAEALIVFSPVYRAAPPGALKNFLDHVPVESLEAKPVGVVAMGATLHHFLGVETNLHPILSWFGAVLVPPSVYLTSKSFEDGVLTPAAAEDLRGYAGTVADMATRLRGFRLSPRPLAAQAAR